jgi:hypothetical protein
MAERQMSVSVKSKAFRNALFAVVAATAAMGATVGVAEAKHKKHFGIVVDLGSPYYGAYSGYGYDSPCRWLKRKAIHTGSSYWWRRYQYCVYG